MKNALVLLCLLLGLAATSARNGASPQITSQWPVPAGKAVPADLMDFTPRQEESSDSLPQTGFTKPVPQRYLALSSQPGRVTQLFYASKDYARDGSPLTKTVFVYTPYGYDENDGDTRYDILYLMHGLGGYAGDCFYFAGIRTMFDRLIESGDIPPMIIVSATFYNSKSGYDFSASIDELRVFHLDFEENLMPFVEGRFHTYAASVEPADLKASRDHRAFGGFSLGAVTTWLELCYDHDYIRYYLPMSGSCWYYGTYDGFQTERNVDFIEQLVKDTHLDQQGYFIYHTTGTEDSMKEQSLLQAQAMLKRSGVFSPDRYVFYQMEGGRHNMNAMREYLYNALPLFFRQDEAAAKGEDYAISATAPCSAETDEPID